MPRRLKRCFERVLDPDNLRAAYLKAERGKSKSPAVQLYRQNLDANLEKMRDALVSGTFPVGEYRYFSIYDPKERLICAASFPERVMHHALMNVLDPVFETCQIHDSYACRKGKGNHLAVLRAFHFAKGYGRFLKMDIRKYFDSIDHRILRSLLERRIADKRMLDLLGRIIDSYHTEPGKGLPIGNLTSQYFANHYLCGFDHFVQEKLGVGSYLRYMDDFVLFHHDAALLKEALYSCRDYLSVNLKRNLKLAQAGRSERGLPFLGFLVKNKGIYLQRKTKLRFAKKVEVI